MSIATVALPANLFTRGEQEQVQNLLLQHTQKAALEIVGQPRVNVLELNLALDALKS